MPDEKLISELETMLNEIVELGAAKERTRLGPNLLVTNAAPAGLPEYILVRDDRDGDNILALKVPGVIYNTNDLVNVLFVRGGEAIAFQQGSGSTSSGLWSIVSGTATDIYYNDGDVGIGKAVAPDARLEILDTAQAQLRLTHTEDTKYATFTLDTNHDLTIKPTSTGQIKLQPTTDSTDFFQVLDADGGTPVLNVDSTNERVGVGTATPGALLEVDRTVTDTIIFNSLGTAQPSAQYWASAIDPIIEPQANINLLYGALNTARLDNSANNVTTRFTACQYQVILKSNYSGTVTETASLQILNPQIQGAGAITTAIGLRVGATTSGTNNYAIVSLTNAAANRYNLYISGTADNYLEGETGIGTSSPSAKLHVDQASTTGATPVAYLDQADISEEIVWYRGESAAGTADQSLVDASDFTTPGALLGWIKNKVDDQRAGGLGTIDVWIPFYAIPTA